MATVTVAVAGTGDTSNVATYTTGSFTPAAGDLLVVMACVSGSTTAGGAFTLTGSANGLTTTGDWTRIATATKATGADTLAIWVANSLIGGSPSSMTVTVNVTGDNGTGATVSVARVAGMSRTGSNAVLQNITKSNTASGTPTVTFGAACQSANTVIGFVASATNPAALTPPTNFTEGGDTGFSTPTQGFEWVYRNSGHTSATVTWGNSSGSQYGAIALELDTSSPTVTIDATATATFSGSANGSATHPVDGTATATFAGSSGATRLANTSATATVTFAGSAAASVTLGGSGSATATFSGSGAVALTPGVVGASGSATFAGSGAAAATKPVTASQTATFAGSASAAGVRPVDGTATATFASASAASATKPVSGSASVTFGATADAVSGKVITATTTATFAGGADATAIRPVQGTATVTFAASATATALKPVSATTAATFAAVAMTGLTYGGAGTGSVLFGASADAQILDTSSPFTPPPDTVRLRTRLWWVEDREGVSLLKVDGVWQRRRSPSQDTLAQLVEGETYFRGGYQYEHVPASIKNELIASGLASEEDFS